MKLYGRLGWGSVLVEARLDWYELAYDFEEVGDLFESAAAREALAEINPLAQIPTLELDDGTVPTESAAITLYLADLTGRDTLVPGPSSSDRARFLRWLVFLSPTSTQRLPTPTTPPALLPTPLRRRHFVRPSTATRPGCTAISTQPRSNRFLGPRFSALDIYVSAMTQWRPRRAWFADHTPRLHAIALAAEQQDALKRCFERNFAEPKAD